MQRGGEDHGWCRMYPTKKNMLPMAHERLIVKRRGHHRHCVFLMKGTNRAARRIRPRRCRARFDATIQLKNTFQAVISLGNPMRACTYGKGSLIANGPMVIPKRSWQ